MLKGLTSTFKTKSNATELTYSEYVVLDGTTIPVKATLQDDSYENGNFIGTFILKQISFETEATYEFRNKEFEYYKKIDNESIKIGTFISTDITINDTTEIVKVIGMDYGLKTQIEYQSTLDYASGNITLLDVWNECCTLSDLKSGIDIFTNSDFIVDSDQFSGTGATVRDVMKAVAMSSGTFVKVMNDDKVYLVFNEYTSENKSIEINGTASINDGLKLTNLELDGNTTQADTPTPDTPQPINVVSGRQDIEVAGKNLLDNTNLTITYSNVNASYNTITTIDTGIRYETTYTGGGSPFVLIKVMDLTNYVGKTIRLKSNFTTKGKLKMGYTNATATNRNVMAFTETSGTTLSFVVPDNMGDNHYLYYDIGGVSISQATTIDFTNMILTIDNEDMTYEAYKETTYEINLGKNLLDIDGLSGTSNNVDYSVSNGKLVLNGTLNSDRVEITLSNKLTIQGTYTFSKNYASTIALKDSSYNSVLQVNGNLTEQTATVNSTITKIVIYQTNGTVFDNVEVELQVEKGTKTSFTPYKTPIELCKIGDYKDRIFRLEGKNLFDKDNATTFNGYVSPAQSKIVNNSSLTDKTLYISIQPSTTYTISKVATVPFYVCTSTSIENNTSVSNAINVGNTATTYTITSGANDIYLCLTYYTTSSTKTEQQILDSIMINEGNTALPYEPYGEKGTWYIEKQIGKVVLNGSEIWGISTTPTYTTFYNAYITDYLKTSANICISNYFVSKNNVTGSAGAGSTDKTVCFRYGDNYNYLFISDSDFNSANDFKTWLSTHNTTVYYELATPTYTQITNSELISQLEAIQLREGLNNISITSGDLSGSLKLSYYTNELDTIEDYVELEDKRDTHPWTCLRLGTTQIDGNNLDYIDQDLVDKYGENWLILNDNPFAYNQDKRQQLITNIFNQIKEFGYSSFVSKTSFKPYLTSGDIIRFKNRDGDYVKSILLRYTHNAESIQLEAPSETSATVNYVRPLSDTQKIKNLQIIVDQDKEQIESVVEISNTNANNINNLTQLVDSQGNTIEALGTRITQNVESITASVSAIQSELENGVSKVQTTSVTIDNTGLNVSTDTSKISTQMTNNAFEIRDSGNTTLAYFGYDETEGISKSVMDNLTVDNYFIAGNHRVEKYTEDGENRTGWFYIGG